MVQVWAGAARSSRQEGTCWGQRRLAAQARQWRPRQDPHPVSHSRSCGISATLRGGVGTMPQSPIWFMPNSDFSERLALSAILLQACYFYEVHPILCYF